MSRTKHAVIHEFTFAGTQEIPSDGREVCLVCGEKFSPPGVCIHLFATRGKRILADTDGHGICASCVLAGPKTAAERARKNVVRLRASVLRSRDEDKREYEESYALDAELLSQAFEDLGTFSKLPGYPMAVKIAEASQELEKPRPRQIAKAA
ncbi:hypothetical protein [Candidatus Deferrimicrobium sp.]|uniref:hypothetical protein n=1 Tax=Candidatus Deferrimicrobium sp. TaxID=3060586 RepID=UPI002715DB04|nr:hypothetical protein [Candidatus Deferrimicrobium sp.]MDO8739424.1 hypothetical protein [Candidatus Deferrimicrobium sp.]